MHTVSSSTTVARRDKRQILIGVALFVALLLGVRLFYLQVLHAEELRAAAQGNFLRVEIIPALRGIIRDRNGELLASSMPAFSVTLDPHHEAFRGDRARRIKPRARLDDVVGRLAPILGMDAAQMLPAVQRAMKGTYQPLRIKRNVDVTTLSIIAERRAELPGVSVEADPMRTYPHGSVGSHLLGYIDEVTDEELTKLRDQNYFSGSAIGRAGVERYYEKLLRGQDGIRYVEVNAMGRRSNLFVTANPIPPRAGRELTLTLDWKLQRAAEAALDSAGWAGHGRPPEALGACVAINVRNGEVLALASRPGFDPNEFTAGLSSERWAELNDRKRNPLFNRAIQSRYPPGSTFKPVTLIAGLMAGKVGPSSWLGPCVGGYQYGGRFFKCWNHSGHGMTNGVRALCVSCDVYFYQLSTMLGIDGMAAMARRLHVLEKTGIDLPNEREGFFPTTQWFDEKRGKGNWSKGAALNLAIGQGEVTMTPLQLASMAASLATGQVPRVHVVKDISTPPGEKPIVVDTSPRYTLDVSASALDLSRQGMYAVVNAGEGTARVVRVDSVEVAGKTGSAQHTGKLTHALFICYAPVDDPEIAVAVILENRGGGGRMAAPVARKVLDHYFHPERYEPKPDSLAGDSTAVLAALLPLEPRAPADMLGPSDSTAVIDSLAGD